MELLKDEPDRPGTKARPFVPGHVVQVPPSNQNPALLRRQQSSRGEQQSGLPGAARTLHDHQLSGPKGERHSLQCAHHLPGPPETLTEIFYVQHPYISLNTTAGSCPAATMAGIQQAIPESTGPTRKASRSNTGSTSA